VLAVVLGWWAFIAVRVVSLNGASRSRKRPMSPTTPGNRAEGLTLRQAALIAGFAYLLGPVTYAEFSIYPKLVIPIDIEQTVHNIATHQGLLLPPFSATSSNSSKTLLLLGHSISCLCRLIEPCPC
jgi:hypothetical protein